MIKTSLLLISTVLLICSFSYSAVDMGICEKNITELNAATDMAASSDEIITANGDWNFEKFTLKQTFPLNRCTINYG